MHRDNGVGHGRWATGRIGDLPASPRRAGSPLRAPPSPRRSGSPLRAPPSPRGVDPTQSSPYARRSAGSRDDIISRLRSQDLSTSYDHLVLPRKIEVRSIVPNSPSKFTLTKDTPIARSFQTPRAPSPVRSQVAHAPSPASKPFPLPGAVESGPVVLWPKDTPVEVNSGTKSSPEWGRATVINDGPHGVVVRWADGSAQRLNDRASIREVASRYACTPHALCIFAALCHGNCG
jgi:hypothetical protein